MILVSLLATTALISLARGSPMAYATYRRRELPVDERPELLLVYDRRSFENTDPPLRSPNEIERDYGIELASQNDIPDVASDPESSLARTKKLGLSRNSLSIVNPVDVLRQRVLLELARRKAMQDQRQVDANRRMLETIGKRSIHDLDAGYPRIVGPSHNGNAGIYTSEQRKDDDLRQPQEQHHAYTQRIPVDRTHEWYNVDGSVIRENGDDEARKIVSNYHQDRM